MTGSLHVTLPDEMRAFVDLHANGTNQTPSEYVRALIREDMVHEEDRLYPVRSLLRAEREFRCGEMLPLFALDAVDAEPDEELRSWLLALAPAPVRPQDPSRSRAKHRRAARSDPRK